MIDTYIICECRVVDFLVGIWFSEVCLPRQSKPLNLLCQSLSESASKLCLSLLLCGRLMFLFPEGANVGLENEKLTPPCLSIGTGQMDKGTSRKCKSCFSRHLCCNYFYRDAALQDHRSGLCFLDLSLFLDAYVDVE